MKTGSARRAAALVLGLLSLGMLLQTAGIAGTRHGQAAAAVTRPNVLLIVTDDQRWDTMKHMPLTRERVFRQGVTFTQAFATTPLCCPSRSSILTGLYARNHGVKTNTGRLASPTVVEALDGAGYLTGIVGAKYLNSWPANEPRPEFDFWAVGGSYTQNVVNVDGADVATQGYITDVYRDYADGFLEQALAADAPFALVFAPSAPHEPAIPAPADAELFQDLPRYRPPSYNEADVSDKPAWVRAVSPLHAGQRARIDEYRLDALRSLQSVDRAVDTLLTTLEQHAALDDTLVIFMSDNGYLLGEHRLVEKNKPYSEAVRIPMAIRYPALAPDPRVTSRLVANIDVAPTIYDVTGVTPPAAVDGRSLAPLLRGAVGSWRQEVLIESWNQPFFAVYTHDAAYIENVGDQAELYDLDADPWQLSNVIDDPRYQPLAADLLARLDRLVPPDERTGIVQDELDEPVALGGWSRLVDDVASAESFHTTRQVGQTLRLVTEDAVTRLAILTYRGPDQGTVEVSIDGKLVETVDLYAPSPEYGYLLEYDNLASRVHTLRIRTRAHRDPRSAGNEVRIDAIVAGQRILENEHDGIVYTGWEGTERPLAYLGRARQSSVTGAQVSARIFGAQLSWITAYGPEFGIAEVYVDGVLQATVDLYRPAWQWQARWTISGLSPGWHTVRIRVTGQRNPLASGATVLVDGFGAP